MLFNLRNCFTVEVFDCGSVLSGSVGYFKPSDRQGVGQYDHNLDCMWTITAEANTDIHLLIVDIDIDSDMSCKFDFLKVCHICHKTNEKGNNKSKNVYII